MFVSNSMWVGDLPPLGDGCDPAECTDRLGGEHAPSCVPIDDGPADIPGACVGSGQTSFGVELRQTCPACGLSVLTVADPIGRAIVAHVAPTISPTGEAPSIALDLGG